jgi:endo-1,4-beta-xylanase
MPGLVHWRFRFAGALRIGILTLSSPLWRHPEVHAAMKTAYVAAVLLSSTLAAHSVALPLDLAAAHFRTPGFRVDGTRVVFSGNGQMGDYLQIAESNVYPVIVSAAGKLSAGRWPQLALLVDGLPIQTVTVDSDQPRDYTLRANFTAGLHQLTLAVVNASQDARDFQLTLLSARIDAPEGAPAPVLAALKDWRAEARRREAAALAHADEVVERIRKADAVIRVFDAAGKPAPNTAVQIIQQRHAFLFGCNLFQLDRQPSDADRQRYADAFTALFNYATLPFYWAYEPQLAGPPRQGLVDFCRQHGITMKGHPLLWNTPYGWPAGASALPDETSQRQRVEEVLRQWSPAIEYWDLVNEPTQAAGVNLAAFRWAQQAAPSAKLLINEYGVLSHGSPPFLQGLRNALREGVPIDAVGLQAHDPQGMRYQIDQLQHILDRVAELGRPIQISEVLVPSAGQPMVGSYMASNWGEQRQAEYATQLFRLCFGHPAVTAISWWDLSDRGAWYAGDGLLRQDLSPKPAYEALRKLIRQHWWTQTTAQTGPDGALRFRGFLGDYRIQAVINGQPVTLNAVLESGEGNKWDLRPAGAASQPAATQPAGAS